MNCERINELLPDRTAGSLDRATETAVREHLDGCASCRRDAAEAEETWSLMGRLEDEPSSESMRTRFYSMLAEVQADERRSPEPGSGAGPWARLRELWPRQVSWQVGVAAAMLIAGLWLGTRIGPGSGSGSEIRELRAEMQSMTRMVTLSLLEHQSAAERLRAVSLSGRSGVDGALADALLQVVNNDQNVNVRLAALEVLSGLIGQPDIRTGLVEALGRQRSPMMQVAMADVLLAMNGARPESAVRELLKDDRLDAGVRTHIQQTLDRREDRI